MLEFLSSSLTVLIILVMHYDAMVYLQHPINASTLRSLNSKVKYHQSRQHPISSTSSSRSHHLLHLTISSYKYGKKSCEKNADLWSFKCWWFYYLCVNVSVIKIIKREMICSYHNIRAFNQLTAKMPTREIIQLWIRYIL